MTQEEYIKANEIMAKFANVSEKPKRTALFHQVVQMMARGLEPYDVIAQLIQMNVDLQEGFNYYMTGDSRPFTIPR